MDTRADPETLDVWTDESGERILTSATVITLGRTAVAVALAGYAATAADLTWLLAALGVYWVGDMADGMVARLRGCETRIGATLDILSDRLCAGAFYVGLVWLRPEFAAPVFLYLAEFMVVDCFLSLAFLAWPVRSPNYFFVIDRSLWLWNWSKPAKAANSAIFALLLIVTGWVWLGVIVAVALLALKTLSLVRLGRIGLPVPAR